MERGGMSCHVKGKREDEVVEPKNFIWEIRVF
jgi:hypothetical protein